MATPIKETPVLHGNDAKRFSEKIKQAEKEPGNATELARVRENAKKLKAIEKF